MIGKGILLAAACAVAGCSQPATSDAIANVATPAPSPSASYVSPNLAGGSWDGVFTRPAQDVLDLFARIGIRPGPYEKIGARWQSDAAPTPLTDPSAPNPVTAYFKAVGDQRRLQEIAFTLVEPQMANDQQARDQFDKWIAQALGQLGVTGGDTAVKAIHGEKPLAGKLKGGADYAVTRTTNSKERRLAVTFTRAATGAAETQQGKK